MDAQKYSVGPPGPTSGEKSNRIAASVPCVSPRFMLILYVGENRNSRFFASRLTSMSQNSALPSAAHVTKNVQAPVAGDGFSKTPRGFVTAQSFPNHRRSVTGNTCESGVCETNFGRNAGTPAPAPGAPSVPAPTFTTAVSGFSVSQKHTRPLARPPATSAGFSGLNAKQCTSAGASSTHRGLIESEWSQSNTAPSLLCPPDATRSSNDSRATQDAATTNAPGVVPGGASRPIVLPGSQSTHATVLPFPCANDVNECVSSIPPPLGSPPPVIRDSSSARFAKSSAKMFAHSFCCSARVISPSTLRRNAARPESSRRCARFSASVNSRGSYCVAMGLAFAGVAWISAPTSSGTACVAASTRIGYLNAPSFTFVGRTSIVALLQSSIALTSSSFVGRPKSLSGRTSCSTTLGLPLGTILASSISRSEPWLTHGFLGTSSTLILFFRGRRPGLDASASSAAALAAAASAAAFSCDARSHSSATVFISASSKLLPSP